MEGAQATDSAFVWATGAHETALLVLLAFTGIMIAAIRVHRREDAQATADARDQESAHA